MIELLRTHAAVRRISMAGSLRRRKEIVGDVDLVVGTDAPEEVIAHFTTLPRVARVISRGPGHAAVALGSGITVDLRLAADRAFPYVLHHATGSKEHLTLLQGYAGRRGLTVNEHGLFRGDVEIPCDSEKMMYAALGLDTIVPELREGLGEIEAAAAHRLPMLVEAGAVRGLFHAHTTYSDGRASVAEMVAATRALGYQYLGISDHSQAAHYANGMSPERVRAQHAEIEALRGTFPGFTIFHGAEVDILPDGSLDYPDELLAELDFVIASVHSQFQMARDEMTRRVVRAVRHPAVTMLGHPTGRLLLARDAYALDLDQVLDAARDAGVVIELNANPRRLDLDWRVCRNAKARGVALSINPDAHRTEGLGDVPYGIGIARKGWLEPRDIFNTRSAAEVETYLRARRARAA
jgi:DNA polymerase (family 10)